MVKFKISAARVQQVCTITEYIGALNGNEYFKTLVLRKCAVDNNGEYIVKVTLDDDGDIVKIENEVAANALLDKVTPARYEKLSVEMAQAFRDIVNPTKGRD